MNPLLVVGGVVLGIWLLTRKSSTSTSTSPASPGSSTPPAPSAPPPPLQGVGVGDATLMVYVLRRLFVWSAGKWVLEDSEDGYSPANELYAKYAGAFPGQWGAQLTDPAPPYHYSDGWIWNQTWTFQGSYKNY